MNIKGKYTITVNIITTDIIGTCITTIYITITVTIAGQTSIPANPAISPKYHPDLIYQ